MEKTTQIFLTWKKWSGSLKTEETLNQHVEVVLEASAASIISSRFKRESKHDKQRVLRRNIRKGSLNRSCSKYPLVNCHITMGNHHFSWVNQLWMAMFNSKLEQITRGYTKLESESSVFSFRSSPAARTSLSFSFKVAKASWTSSIYPPYHGSLKSPDLCQGPEFM